MNSSPYLSEKHKQLLEEYNSALPLYKRGIFKVYSGFILTILWFIVWLDAAIRLYGLPYVDFSWKNPRIYILSLILIIIAWKLFKPYRVFTDKSYYGVITGIETGKASKKTGSSGRRIFYANVTTLNLEILACDGKTRYKKVFATKGLNEIYQKGTEVSVICGEKYPVPLDRQLVPQGKALCTKCGSLEDKSYTYCYTCHRLLWFK